MSKILIVIVAIAAIAVVLLILRRSLRSGDSEGAYGNYGSFDSGRGGVRICPYCGEKNSADSVFCGGCGAPLASEAPGMVCPYCGFPAESGDTFCGNCGTPLGNSGSSSAGNSYPNTDIYGDDRTEVLGADDSDATVLMDDYAASSACLEYFDNGLAQRIRLQKEITRIGSKDRDTDYVLPSRKVSKLHAQIRREGDRYLLKDLGSTNGTYLNGSSERLSSGQETGLHDGDKIRMADIELVFKC